MKTIKRVFLVIATLVLIFILWGLFFNDGGILRTAYNALINPVNKTWQTITGDSSDSSKLLPNWGDAKVKTDTNWSEQDKGFKN